MITVWFYWGFFNWNFLNIENKFSKHGYHKSNITKKGENIWYST